MPAAFRNEMSWASNMYPCKIRVNTIFGEITAPCSEVLYAAAKAYPTNPELARSILSMPNGYAAKKAAKGIHLTPEVAVFAMRHIVLEKFKQNPDIAQKLLQCPNELLVERNYWHDNFWGACDCIKCTNIKKRNMLGKILQEVKEKLDAESNY